MISMCVAELAAPIQGEALLQREEKQFKPQVSEDFGAIPAGNLLVLL